MAMAKPVVAWIGQLEINANVYIYHGAIGSGKSTLLHLCRVGQPTWHSDLMTVRTFTPSDQELPASPPSIGSYSAFNLLLLTARENIICLCFGRETAGKGISKNFPGCWGFMTADHLPMNFPVTASVRDCACAIARPDIILRMSRRKSGQQKRGEYGTARSVWKKLGQSWCINP